MNCGKDVTDTGISTFYTVEPLRSRTKNCPEFPDLDVSRLVVSQIIG
jgi:hypothetical protein